MDRECQRLMEREIVQAIDGATMWVDHPEHGPLCMSASDRPAFVRYFDPDRMEWQGGPIISEDEALVKLASDPNALVRHFALGACRDRGLSLVGSLAINALLPPPNRWQLLMGRVRGWFNR